MRKIEIEIDRTSVLEDIDVWLQATDKKKKIDFTEMNF